MIIEHTPMVLPRTFVVVVTILHVIILLLKPIEFIINLFHKERKAP